MMKTRSSRKQMQINRSLVVGQSQGFRSVSKWEPEQGEEWPLQNDGFQVLPTSSNLLQVQSRLAPKPVLILSLPHSCWKIFYSNPNEFPERQRDQNTIKKSSI